MTDTTMTVYESSTGVIFVYHDRNGMKHMLSTWEDGGVTFRWDWRDDAVPSLLDRYYRIFTGHVDPHLQRLAEAWLEYLDAAVIKETW